MQLSVMYTDMDMMNTKVPMVNLLHQMQENKRSNVDKYFSVKWPTYIIFLLVIYQVGQPTVRPTVLSSLILLLRLFPCCPVITFLRHSQPNSVELFHMVYFQSSNHCPLSVFTLSTFFVAINFKIFLADDARGLSLRTRSITLR
jgi:hypothetical protein